MENVFKQPKGDFVIKYVDESQIDIYNGINPISITFRPSTAMQPYEALEYANEFAYFIVKEAKAVLKEQNKFFKEWEIRFSNQFTGKSDANDDVDAKFLTIGKVVMNIYCKKNQSRLAAFNNFGKVLAISNAYGYPCFIDHNHGFLYYFDMF